MLSYTEIAPKKVLVLDGEPYEVLSTSGVVKKQRQKPHNSAKLKNLKSGSVIERTFSQADKVEEADLETRELKYIYSRKGESWFCPPDTPGNRFALPIELVADKLPYLREGDVTTALVFDDEILGIRIPIKVDLKVVEAPPNVRGNTAQGGTKQVTLETGLTVAAPLFVEVGDVIRVNTETGAYAERAK